MRSWTASTAWIPYAAGLKKTGTHDYFIANGRLDEIHGKQTENEKQLRLAGYDLESLIKKRMRPTRRISGRIKFIPPSPRSRVMNPFRARTAWKEQEDSLCPSGGGTF